MDEDMREGDGDCLASMRMTEVEEKENSHLCSPAFTATFGKREYVDPIYKLERLAYYN